MLEVLPAQYYTLHGATCLIMHWGIDAFTHAVWQGPKYPKFLLLIWWCYYRWQYRESGSSLSNSVAYPHNLWLQSFTLIIGLNWYILYRLKLHTLRTCLFPTSCKSLNILFKFINAFNYYLWFMSLSNPQLINYYRSMVYLCFGKYIKYTF